MVATMLPAACCFAQSSLPSDIVTASVLTDGQKDTLKQFVDSQTPALAGAPLDVKRARRALIEPLENNAVSVQFRLEYSRFLSPALRPLAQGDQELNAINALIIAGGLATTTGIDILADSLSDKRSSVRFAAVSGFESTFSALDRTTPAVAPPSQAVKALNTLKTAMAKETDSKVMEAYALALQAGTKVPSSRLPGVRSEAVRILSQSMGAKAQTITDASFDAAFRRAANAARNALTNQDINEPALDRAVLLDAAGFAGDLLASVYRRVKAGELEAPADATDDQLAALRAKRADFVLIAADAERTIQWAHNGIAGNPLADLKLSELLAQEKDAAFTNDVLRIIGANGALTAAPYQFPDNRFVK